MRFMLDTHVVGALLVGNKLAQGQFGLHLGAIGLSSILLFELRTGFARSRTAVTNLQALDVLLSSGVAVVAFDENDAGQAGSLRRKMETVGKTMGAYDLLVAAQALRLDAILVSNDTAFASVEGLRVEDWAV